MTRLAGNPPVHAADSDLSIALVGLAVGLLLAAVSLVITRPWLASANESWQLTARPRAVD
jgi:hypothetical protein